MQKDQLQYALKRNSICCKLPNFDVGLWFKSEVKWFRKNVYRQIATKKWKIAWWVFGWRLKCINIPLADH